MGSQSHDFLADSILFDESMLADGFRSVPAERLRSELDAYRAHTMKHADDLLREVYACESATKIFAGVRNAVSFDLLKQTAFYADQVVLDDPLFAAAFPGTVADAVLRDYHGGHAEESFQERVVEAARFMKRITPFIAANYVKVLPVSAIFEPEEDGLPLTASENRFDDGLPPDIMRFYRDRAVVRCLRRDGGTLIEVNDEAPCRNIAVRFRDDESDYVRLFELWENRVVSFDDSTRTATFAMTLPGDPPEQAYFDSWVHQSINQTAIAVHRELTTEFHLSRSLKAAYLTKSPLGFTALQNAIEGVSVARPISTLANIRLPFVAGVDPELLMRIRQEESDAFERFRRHFDKHLRAVAATDAGKRQDKIEDVSAELKNDAAEVGAVVARARKKLAAQGTLTAAALTAGVLSSGWTLPLVLTGAAGAYAAYQDYRVKVEAPAYFLWRVSGQE